MRSRARALLAVVLAMASLLVACGLPKDSNPRVIAEDKVPFSLLGPTTTAAVQSGGDQAVTLYFVDGDHLRRVVRRVQDASPTAVLNLLSAVGPDDPGGLTATLPPAAKVLKASVEDQVLVVTLSSEINNVQGTGLRNALAGLVYTSYDLLDIRGVRFRFVDADGQEQNLNAITDDQTTTNPVRPTDYSREAPR